MFKGGKRQMHQNIKDSKKGAKHFKNCGKFCTRFMELVGLVNSKWCPQSGGENRMRD